MKLAMLIPEFPTQTHIFFWREIEALRQLGVEVVVVSTRRPQEGCPHPFAREAAPQTRYVYPPRMGSALNTLARPARVAAAARYIASLAPASRAKAVGYALCAADLAAFLRKEHVQHLHIHSCAEAAHLGALTRAFGGPDYSLHLHGDLDVYGTDHAQKMKAALFVATASRPLQDQVASQAGYPADRTFCMKMGVDTTRFSPRPDTMAGSAIHVVSVSRLALCKGHEYGLQAIRAAVDAGVDIRYSIVGSGPDEAHVRQAIDRLALHDRVSLLGPKSELEIAALLQSADLFLLTSVGQGEASPVAVMEAMASGVPALCSIIGGTPDMIADGTDGLLAPQADVPALTAALNRLWNDRGLLRTLGANARRRAEEEFDARVPARRFIEVVRTLGAGRQRPA